MRKNDLEPLLGNRTRQSPLAILILIFAFLRSLLNGLWPILLFLFVRGGEFLGSYWVLILIVAGALSLITSLLYYLRFFFTLEQDKIRVEKGIISRSTVDIPFDRIQNISFEEGIIHQVFDIVKIKIDTAGSAKEEFSFHALDRAKAIALREYIFSRKDEHQQEMESRESLNRILHLSFIDLLKVGFSQNHLRTVSLALAALIGFYENFENILGDLLFDRLEMAADTLLSSSILLIMAFFLFLLIFLLLGTIVITVLRYYDFSLFSTGKGYRLEAGLFNRKEQSAAIGKVQFMQWIQNPLKKLFHIHTVRLYLAGSSEVRKNQTLTIPGARKEHLHAVQNRLFVKFNSEEDIQWYKVNHHLLFRRIIFLAVLPFALFLSLSIWKSLNWIGFLAIGFLGLSIWFQFRYYARRNYRLDDQHLMTSAGVIEHWQKMLEIKKVQGITLKQSPYQRRYNLGSVILHTASGNIGIPYLEFDKALEIKNFILYQSERQKGAWM